MRKIFTLVLAAMVSLAMFAPTKSQAGPFVYRGGAWDRYVSPWVPGLSSDYWGSSYYYPGYSSSYYYPTNNYFGFNYAGSPWTSYYYNYPGTNLIYPATTSLYPYSSSYYGSSYYPWSSSYYYPWTSSYYYGTPMYYGRYGRRWWR